MIPDALLSRLTGVKKYAGGQYTARCPAHDDQHNSLSVFIKPDGTVLLNCHRGCPPEKIVAALGLEMRDLFPDPPVKTKPPEKAEVVDRREYVYKNSDGTPCLRKVKVRKSDGSKEYYWQHLQDGQWEKGRAGIIPPLYNLDLLMNTDDLVYVVEGEKDANTIHSLGLNAVSLPDGAKSKWREEYGDLFEGKRVYIIPDNDAPGYEYAETLARKLYTHSG